MATATESIAALQSMGYIITLAFEGGEGEPDVLSVCGPGINTQVSSDDTDTLERLANPKAHESRVLQESADATPEQIFRADLDAQVAVGDVSKQDADAKLASFEEAATNGHGDPSVASLLRALQSLPDGPIDKGDLIKALQS